MTLKTALNISAEDLRRHKRKLGLITEANQLSADAEQAAAQANAQIQALLEQRLKKIGAFEDWAQELHDCYGLDASKGEGVNEDGSIIRAIPAPNRATRRATARAKKRSHPLRPHGGPAHIFDRGGRMAFTTITITGGPFTRPDGTYAQGTCTLTLSEAIQNGTQVIDPTPVVGSFVNGMLKNSSGLPFTAIATDDTATSPKGAKYSIVLQLDSAPIRQGSAALPSAAPGGTIDLNVLLPAP